MRKLSGRQRASGAQSREHIHCSNRHFMHNFRVRQCFRHVSWNAVGMVDCVWNVMAQAQKPDFVFRRNGRVHLNRQGRQFSRLLAAEVCASALVMLDTPRSEVVWRVLATHSTRRFPLHFPSSALPCAIRFQTHSTWSYRRFSALQSCKCFCPFWNLQSHSVVLQTSYQ